MVSGAGLLAGFFAEQSPNTASESPFHIDSCRLQCGKFRRLERWIPGKVVGDSPFAAIGRHSIVRNRGRGDHSYGLRCDSWTRSLTVFSLSQRHNGHCFCGHPCAAGLAGIVGLEDGNSKTSRRKICRMNASPAYRGFCQFSESVTVEPTIPDRLFGLGLAA